MIHDSNIVHSFAVFIYFVCLPLRLSNSLLTSLRRERNRMHAKMTRDRKRCFIASLKRVISKLEKDNQHLSKTLERYRATDESEGNPSTSLQAMSNSTQSCALNSSLYTVG